LNIDAIPKPLPKLELTPYSMNTPYRCALAVIVCALLSANVYAQDGLSAGAKVVGNLNKFNATDAAFGYGVGGFATMQIIGPLSGRGELLYVSYAGSMSDASAVSGTTTASYKNRSLRFHSLEIPLMAVYDIPFLENLNPKVAAGWAYSYNFGAFQISDNTYTVQDASGGTRTVEYKNTSENVSSEFQPYNSSFLGSLSINFEKMHVDLRYQQGIPNLSQNNTVETSRYFGDFKTMTLSVSVGYRIL
jgi:hypothetical protein